MWKEQPRIPFMILYFALALHCYSFFMFLTIQKTRSSSIRGCSVSVPCSEFVTDRWKFAMFQPLGKLQRAKAFLCFGQRTKQRSFGREARDKALPYFPRSSSFYKTSSDSSFPMHEETSGVSKNLEAPS